MEFTTTQLILTGLIFFFGGIVQGTIGFAMGLICTPLMMFIGIPLEYIIVFTTISSLFQGTHGLIKLRKETRWKEAALPIALRMAFIFLGIWVLTLIKDLPTDTIKRTVGAVIFIMVLFKLKGESFKNLMKKTWMIYPTFSLSGFFSGLIGMGGPPIVLWTIAQPWSAKETRAFIYCLFTTTLPLQLALMFYHFGEPIVRTSIIAVCTVPAVVLGSVIGLKIGDKLSKEGLVKIACGVLILLSLKLIVFP